MVSIAICLAWLVIAAEASEEIPKAASTTSAPESAWSQHWSERKSVHLDWQVVRDSRSDGNLGFQPSSAPARGQLWLGAEQGRIDQACLVVPRRDGDYHPQDRTTAGNRQEFRHALFYQHLAGPNPVPEWKPISLTVTPTQLLPDNRWGNMTQLSSLAPVLAAAPYFALRDADIELSKRTAHFAGRKLPILIAKPPVSDSWELWVDPESDYRVVRCLCRDHGGSEKELEGTRDRGAFASDGNRRRLAAKPARPGNPFASHLQRAVNHRGAGSHRVSRPIG